MLVFIKSGPDTTEGKRAVVLAKDMNAGVCLIQNGVYFCRETRTDWPDKVYAIDEDMKMRGIKPCGGVQRIRYDEAVDLMAASDNVVGMF